MTTPGAEITVSNSEEALSLLRMQDSLYRRLEEFATRQRSLVTRDDTAPLLALLAARQKLASELAHLSRRLEPVRRQWSLFLKGMSESQRAEAQELLANTQERLRAVMDRDEYDARLLSVRKAAVAKSLHAAHGASRALQAYREPAPEPANDDRSREELA